MQPIIRLFLETAWSLRFELIFLVVTAAVALLPQLVLPWYRRRYDREPLPPRPRPQQKSRQPSSSQQLQGADAPVDGRREDKLEKKYDGRLDGRIQPGGPAHPGSGRPRLRPGPGASSPSRRPGAASGAPAGTGGADRVMARQAARMILAESCRERGRPLEMHQDALAGGACFEQLPEAEAHRLYLTLGLAALRNESGEPAVALLQDMRRHGAPVPPPLLALIVKRCTARRLFRKALAAFDAAAADSPLPPPAAAGAGALGPLAADDRDLWSSLLFSAVECGEHARCDFFWSSLKAVGTPNAQDYACMLRASAVRGHWEDALRLVEAARGEGLVVDPATGHAALQACVQARQLQAGVRILELLEQDDGRGGKDVAPYNALMKGFAHADDLEEVFRLHSRMQERGVDATQVTYGILLDACVSRSDLESAAAVFHEMVTRGCPMNTVLYTTLIKGLARAGLVDKAMEVYTHMREQSNVQPDTILFSVLIKSNCDAGRTECALRLFESMIELGCQPDEIVFNNLLVGCSRDGNLDLGLKLRGEMKRLGVQPSHATASILIKLYAKCHVLDGAQYLLANISEELGLEPEARLFAQLVHASLRERDGRRAMEVYGMMMQAAPPDSATTGSILSTCLTCGLLNTAVEIHNATVQAGLEVPAKDSAAVQRALELAAARRTQGGGFDSAVLLGKRWCYCGP